VVPPENSTGEKRRQGTITTSGSRHARRLLVEAAWHYRKAPRSSQVLARRQAGQPDHVLQISGSHDETGPAASRIRAYQL